MQIEITGSPSQPYIRRDLAPMVYEMLQRFMIHCLTGISLLWNPRKAAKLRRRKSGRYRKSTLFFRQSFKLHPCSLSRNKFWHTCVVTSRQCFIAGLVIILCCGIQPFCAAVGCMLSECMRAHVYSGALQLGHSSKSLQAQQLTATGIMFIPCINHNACGYCL